MRKLVESTFITLDGSIGNPQDWGPSYWDDEHSAYAARLLEPAEALLLGRVTYDGFAASWPQRSGDAYTDKMNAMPKYVASTTLGDDTTWNATVLSGDTAEAVAALKAEDGGDLLKFGTGELDRTLIEAGLLDEIHFWVFPVLGASGDRVSDAVPLTHLRLLGTTPFASGIVVHTYGPKS